MTGAPHTPSPLPTANGKGQELEGEELETARAPEASRRRSLLQARGKPRSRDKETNDGKLTAGQQFSQLVGGAAALLSATRVGLVLNVPVAAVGNAGVCVAAALRSAAAMDGLRIVFNCEGVTPQAQVRGWPTAHACTLTIVIVCIGTS